MTVRSFTAVVNPNSGDGGGTNRWRALGARVAATGASVSVELTRDDVHATELARDAASRGHVVAAVGGDGLVMAVVSGIVAAGGGTLAIVPAGRGNDLARKLGITAEPDALTTLLVEGQPRPLDVLDVDGVIVPGNLYAGIDSVAARLINARRFLPAKFNYRTAPLEAFVRWQPPTFTVTVDDTTVTTPAHLVVVANSGWYGHGLNIVPQADVGDGLFDVLIARASQKRKFVRFMSQVEHGTHVDRSDVTVLRGTTASIRADRPIPAGADGEDIGELPRTVRLLPAALNVLAP